MITIMDQVLFELDGMNTAARIPHPIDECKAKEMFIYLKEFGFPLSSDQVKIFGLIKNWDEGFIMKMAAWVDIINAGGELTIKHPGHLTEFFKKKSITDRL